MAGCDMILVNVVPPLAITVFQNTLLWFWSLAGLFGDSLANRRPGGFYLLLEVSV
jgi:hypothetical protein